MSAAGSHLSLLLVASGRKHFSGRGDAVMDCWRVSVTHWPRWLKSVSRHSYPQSACGGASTNLSSLMSHSYVQLVPHACLARCGTWIKKLTLRNRGIVSYTRQYKSEAAAAHAAGIKYFLGETNSGWLGVQHMTTRKLTTQLTATCGGGGISPVSFNPSMCTTGVDLSQYRRSVLLYGSSTMSFKARSTASIDCTSIRARSPIACVHSF